jgi:Ca-activated chloride channel homolog
MRALILAAFICLFVGPASGAGPRTFPSSLQTVGGEAQYKVEVDVDLVIFNVTVTDSSGRHLSLLKQSDFHIYEESRLQDITLFEAEDVPASVGLVIDNSGSMHNKRADVAKAALAFAASSNLEDEMFVVNFNEKVYQGLPPEIQFTNDLEQIRSALLRTAPVGLTALYDALAAGIDHLKAGTRYRKALVVLSDGGDNASHRTLEEVVQISQLTSATIYTIGFYDETNRDRNPAVLRKIATLSGGRAYFPDSASDLEQVWRDIAGAIRSQYTIGYRSSNPKRDGLFRNVKITVSRGGGRTLRVTTRPGYVGRMEK